MGRLLGAVVLVFAVPASVLAQGFGGALADPMTGEPGRPLPPPGEANAQPGAEPQLRFLLIDAATFGIDPVVGRVASARMRATAQEMGYDVVTPEDSVAVAQQQRMPYPPTPADLWRVCWASNSARGAFARIWAHAGQYVIAITVASVDGAGPFFARETAGADDLRDVVDRLLRAALPPPSIWNGAASQVAATPAPVGAQGRVNELDDQRRSRPNTPRPADSELRRFSLVLQTEGAIGASSDVFYNHLVGARFDVRITSNILIGAYVAYANLNGRNGRTSNILMLAQLEHRIRISPNLDVTIPLRVAGGYLPLNGPVLRFAAGLNYVISPEWEIGADLLVPTIWFLPDHTSVSIDVAIEGAYRF